MKVFVGFILLMMIAFGIIARNVSSVNKTDYSTIKELLENEYDHYFSETDEEGNRIIDIQPGQMIIHENRFYIFYLDVYEGMNGEGDQGIGIVYTEDMGGKLIDYKEIYTGSFGDSFQETVEVYLIPQDQYYIHQHLDGIENIEWVDGYPTGDPFTKESYLIGTVDASGIITERESDYADDFCEQYLLNTNDAIVKDIRKYYGIIEKCITQHIFNVQTFKDGNKTYDVYTGDNYLKRITVSELSDMGKQMVKHYYLKVNSCFFIYETGELDQEKIENRIYFFKEKVFRILKGADKKMMAGAELSLKGLDSKLESESVIEIVNKR
jgi:hypothetical protein